MRILVKILLFPITLMLSILVLFCKFICLFSAALLSIISFVIFGLCALGLLFTVTSASPMFSDSDIPSFIGGIIFAYLISPYGIPMFAAWLIGIIEGFNEFLKAI